MSRSLGIDIGGTSIKAALLEGGEELWCARSVSYRRPDQRELLAALRGLISGGPSEVLMPEYVGVCAPGLLAPDGRSIALAVNVPGLVGLEFGELLGHAGIRSRAVNVVTDAFAAAFDFAQQQQIKGRLLAVSIGTGVGACVLDDSVPLVVTGSGPGHLGQMDVSGIEVSGERVPIGPDGGRGSLEAYLGLPALRARYGEPVENAIAAMKATDVPCLALARAIRMAHAIYRPNVIVLLGGVGIRLSSVVEELRAAAAIELTSLARTGWTLRCGDSDYHAARGAARLAASVVG